MTLSSDAATDCLWRAGAPVISDSWNLYSPSSSLSSQPCSPGTTGGLAGHAEKNFGELAPIPLATQESLYGNKRIRLTSETSTRVCVQGYRFETSQATSAQLGYSVTPSPQSVGVNYLLQPSGLGKLISSRSTPSHVALGASLSANQAQQRLGEAPVADVYNNIFIALPPKGNESLGNSNGPLSGQAPSWATRPQLPLQQQPLPHPQIDQQLAGVATEQVAQACSTAISSLALTLTLCDMRSQAPPGSSFGHNGLLQGCSTTGGGCPPPVGAFTLPFVFTGTGPMPMQGQGAPPVLHQVPTLPAAAALAPLPSSAPPVGHSVGSLPCSLSSVLFDPGLRLPSNARMSAGNVQALPVMLSTLGSGTSSVPQLPAAQSILPVAPAAPPTASQLATPCLAHLLEPAHCAAATGTATRVLPQAQQSNRQPPLLKVRLAHSKRVRPPSPSPPSMPSTPPHPGYLGSEDWILHVAKVLGMSEPDTARLALHCWRRISELPQLHHATRLWSSAMSGRNLYATACLWVSIKLEEKRRAAPGGVVLAHLATTTPAALCSAELAVMNWLEWRPYDGYRLDESHLLVYM